MIRVRTILTGWGGAPGLHTVYFLEDGTAASTVAAEAFTRVHAFWETLEDCFPNTFNATQDQLVDEMDSATGNLIGGYAQAGANVSTGLGSDGLYLPAQTMVFIQHKTGVVVGTRRLRGGSYIGPMGAAAIGIDGKLKNTFQAIVAGAAIALKADLPSGGTQCVWHRPTALEPSSGEAHPVFDTYVGPVFAHLTSRRR